MRTRRMRGLTLLEMMVVLLIAGMALALGFQSLGQWQRAEEALDGSAGQTREAMLSEVWWRDSVRGITALFGAKVSGDSRAFSATSTGSVLGAPGAALPIRWQLQVGAQATSLLLDEDGRTATLSLPYATAAQFVYFDAGGDRHEQWPPSLGEQKPLPAAIALVQEDSDGGIRVWLGAMTADPAPISPQFELERD